MYRRIIVSVLVLLLAGGLLFAGDPVKGKQLFKDNCAACHHKNMKDKLVGPGLGGVQERWADYPKKDLYDWIRNAPAMVDKGHKRAVEVFNEFNKLPMTAFPNLTDEDIANILAYVDAVYKGEAGQPKGAGAAGSAAQLPPNFDKGKQLFKDNCASCHHKNMKDKLVGPGLGGVQERWADYPKEDLYSWVRNSQALVDKGHKRAVEVFNEFNKLPMTAFPNLKDDDIDAILAYVDAVYKGLDKKAAAATTPKPGSEKPTAKKTRSPWLYALLLAVLALLGAYLWYRGNQLEYLAAMKRGDKVVAPPKSFLGTLFGKPVLGFLIFAATVGLTFIAADQAIFYGRQQGYQPEQPIKFSHKTHAGINKIDCQFCHDGARRSRHSNIPEGSTCIKCHAAIKKGSTYGTAELTKIYAAMGWDPNTEQYIPNYEQLSQDEVKAIFTKWIRSQNSDAKDVDKLVKEQWDGIKAALTNDQKPNVQGPVEWIRIHALPDHVYFNHSQHVEVAGLACQTCHGKVEEMDVVKQVAPLSMGWCINCHRKTPVKFQENPYYTESYPWHKELLETGQVDQITVGDLGGTECQKCHY